MGRMKRKLHYKHIIDLEYFCHQDSESDNDQLHLRDRKLFLDGIKQLDKPETASACELLLLWLKTRTRQAFPTPEQKSPGAISSDVYLLARNLAILLGIFTGLSAGFSFFTYSGTTPVNVFHFLLLFVISQLALVFFLVTAMLLRPLLPGLKIPSFYAVAFRGLMGGIVSFFQKKWLHSVAAEKRLSVNHAFGIFKARSSIYGSLFYWPLFALAQLFAIGFNIGLLGSTLLKILTSDLAFGWQSTMQFSAEAIHRAVMLAALPWSWFVPQASSYPTLAEIEGSRIILKEGIYHLSTGDLIAWWPFLLFCLLFYGLFLRLALFSVGKVMELYSLRNLRLDTPACRAIIRRMQTPLVSTQAEPEAAPTKTGNQAKDGVSSAAPNPAAQDGQVVLIPDDIYSLCPIDKLQQLLQKRGFAVNEMHRFMVSYEEDRQLLRLLAEKKWTQGEGIFILMEGWMVPLVDFLSLLKELRTLLQPNSIIHLGLVGRPKADAFTPVSPEDFTIWQQKIEALADPYLTVFSLIS